MSYQVHEPFYKIPEFDPIKKEHYWTIVGIWHYVPREDPGGFLDKENLVTLTPLMCHYCHMHLTDLTLKRICPGPGPDAS